MSRIFRLPGRPSAAQKRFFDSRAKYVAYGGARGGGKSWALRRKLTLMALRWPGIKLLLLRRSYPELYVNHIQPLRAELKGAADWQEAVFRTAEEKIREIAEKVHAKQFPNSGELSMWDRDTVVEWIVNGPEK